MNGNSGGNLTSLIVPAATAGAVGYGYMWWKGFSFSDFMYVIKQNMSAAVSNMTKQLDHVSEALNAAKKHITKRIENLQGKVDDQVEMSNSIKKEVVNVRDNVSDIYGDLNLLQTTVSELDDKLSLEQKQNLTNMGVWYLCNKADGEDNSAIKGMKEIANGLGAESIKLLKDGNAEHPAW